MDENIGGSNHNFETVVPPEPLRIKAASPRITRINRALVKAGVLGLSLVVVLAVYWGFGRAPVDSPSGDTEIDDSPQPQSAVPMDSFNRLPKGYSELRETIKEPPRSGPSLRPRPSLIGPRLDGELGPAQRGMEEALLKELCIANELPERICRLNGQSMMSPMGSARDEDKNAQLARLKQDADALKGPVFFGANDGGTGYTVNAGSAAPSGSASTAEALDRLNRVKPTTPTAITAGEADTAEGDRSSTLVENNQSGKTAFLRSNPLSENANERMYDVIDATSPYVVQAGTLIPCVLMSGLNSDLPGDVTCQVRESVYDTSTGRFILIPQGARLIGSYDSAVTYGQSRVLLVWRRILFPDGSSVNTDALPALDLAGYGGLNDQVNHHYGRLVSGILASSLLGAVTAGLEEGDEEDDRFKAELLNSAGATINRAGQKITQKNLDIQPTLEIRPGWSFNVLVNKDLTLKPFFPK